MFQIVTIGAEMLDNRARIGEGATLFCSGALYFRGVLNRKTVLIKVK
eukprot:UN20256